MTISSTFSKPSDLDTLRAITGNGFHLYFSLPKGLSISGQRIGPGVDIIGDGRYAVVPPSVHPTGVRYRWVEGSCVPGSIKPLPEGLLAATAAFGSRSQDAPRGEVRVAGPISAERLLEQMSVNVRTAKSGSRNVELNKVAFTMGGFIASGSLKEGAVRSFLIQAARESGLGEIEIARTIESGLRAGMNRPFRTHFPGAK